MVILVIVFKNFSFKEFVPTLSFEHLNNGDLDDSSERKKGFLIFSKVINLYKSVVSERVGLKAIGKLRETLKSTDGCVVDTSKGYMMFTCETQQTYGALAVYAIKMVV